jgi:3-deoxy-D-manno-octulosonate 8-phosphate phosphatase (KDO 8-P phosphatase)
MTSLSDRCRNIEFILSDVDGVLTNGGIVFDNQGIETKQFHSRDGLGIKLWRRAGGKFGLLTARASHIVKLRSSELGVDVLRQGFEDKLPAAQQLFSELHLDPAKVCYIGDDLPDLPVMQCVGFGVAVADAAEEIRQAAHHVTDLAGGQGAVRETIEFILKIKGSWDGIVGTYRGS